MGIRPLNPIFTENREAVFANSNEFVCANIACAANGRERRVWSTATICAKTNRRQTIFTEIGALIIHSENYLPRDGAYNHIQ